MIAFTEAARFFFPANIPNPVTAFFLNTQDNALEQRYPAGVWNRIQLPDAIPREARAVLLAGNLIITQGAVPQLAEITVAVRRAGETSSPVYIWQCIEAHAGGGQRSPVCAAVPVDRGAFELRWDKRPAGIVPDWPEAPAFGVNLFVNGFWL